MSFKGQALNFLARAATSSLPLEVRSPEDMDALRATVSAGYAEADLPPPGPPRMGVPSVAVLWRITAQGARELRRLRRPAGRGSMFS